MNRVGGEAKDKGFVVDYVGIGHHLKKALDNYDEREQKEVVDVLSFPEQELRELRASHDAILALLKKHKLTDLSDHDAFFDVFYDEELEKLRLRIVNAGKEPTYGLHRKKQMPIFRMLKREIFGDNPLVDANVAAVADPPAIYGMNGEERVSHLVALTQHLYGDIEQELKLIGFWESIPASGTSSAPRPPPPTKPKPGSKNTAGFWKRRFSLGVVFVRPQLAT